MAVQIENVPKITIDGLSLTDYIVTDIVLDKGLLHPSCLVFKMRRKTLLRNDGDIYFDIATSMLGSSVSLSINTLRRDEHMDEMSETLTFSGIIFNARTSREVMGSVAYIEVTAYSPDYLLVDNPHCASFEDKSLDEIINEVIGVNGNAINADLRPCLTARLPYTVQYNETSYQFISRLAQRFGEYLFFDNDRFYFGQTPQGKNLMLYQDIDILGYSYQLGMEHTDFHHAQHNYLKYSNTSADGYSLGSESLHGMTDMVYEHSHATYRKATLQDMHSTSQEYSPFSQNELSATVEALGAKARMMTCHVRTNRADICIGDRISIVELSDEGSPSTVEHQELMVVGVNYHSNIDGHFENEITAVPTDSPYPPYGVEDLYPVCESQRAQVVDNRDPEQLGRIRVQFLWQQLQPGQCATPWLRITQPHGGNDKGFYFIPEIGEEVMVAFENGNGEKPYVVGTLYHGDQQPGRHWPHSSNDIKAIRTRNGHTVEIHDSGSGGYIRIYDYKKENYILTYSTDEKLIKLESTGNIELDALHDIVIHAHNDIIMTADNNMDIKVGHNRTANVGDNDSETVGKQQIINIGERQEKTIGSSQIVHIAENQEVSIDGNQYVDVTEDVSHTSKNYNNDVTEKIHIFSKNHEQKSDKKMDIDGGDEINITASQVKIN